MESEDGWDYSNGNECDVNHFAGGSLHMIRGVLVLIMCAMAVVIEVMDSNDYSCGDRRKYNGDYWK